LLVPMVDNVDQAANCARRHLNHLMAIAASAMRLTRAARFSQIADYGTTADECCDENLSVLCARLKALKGWRTSNDILKIDGSTGGSRPADLAGGMG